MSASGQSQSPTPEFVGSVQPVVLVGGRSRRFGRDKLLEPWHGSPLVQRPINALRAVMGPRVRLVGACNPRAAAMGDGVLTDPYPGSGPLGGIVAALEAWAGPVFVLAGDMPNVSPRTVLSLLAHAQRAAAHLAVLAATDRLHPCVGVYMPAALEALAARLARGERRLSGALPPDAVLCVPVDEREVWNVNHPEDAAGRGSEP